MFSKKDSVKISIKMKKIIVDMRDCGLKQTCKVHENIPQKNCYTVPMWQEWHLVVANISTS